MSYIPVGLIIERLTILAAMKGILVVSVGVGVSAAILAWRERPQPGAIPLVFLLGGQCWWSATILFRITATDSAMEVFWLHTSWVGTVVIPVAWLFFCLEYTGYRPYVQPRYIVIASVIPVLTVVISFTNSYHHLLYVDTTVVERSQRTVLLRTPGVWYWVIAAYTYVVGLLGAIPLLQFITSDVDMFQGQSLALLVGLITPWAANFLYLLGVLPTAGIDPTPAAFSVSGAAYLGAIARFQLFGTSPAPIRQARATAFERMQNGAVVVDSRNHIVAVNRRSEQIFDMDSDELLGRRVEDVIPNISRIAEDQSQSGQSILRTGGGTDAYDISINRFTNSRGQTTGRIITLHDISEYVRQQQRLEVLNRVFRHNIRTNTQVIIGKADYLADHNSEREARKVQENALEIETVSDNVRTVLDVFEQSREQTELVSLETLLRDCVATVKDRYPAVTVTADLSNGNVYVNSILEEVFINLVENAAEHNTNADPQVWIEVESDREQGRVTVADNGPGIDRKELSLLEEGTETPLNHGTGFGLAIIIWGTEIAGGEITFDENDPTGLVATVELPLYSEDSQAQDVHPLTGPLSSD
jgi:PAS domain S-box-containing protein